MGGGRGTEGMQAVRHEVIWKHPMKPVRVTEAVFDGIVTQDRYVMEKKYDGWRAVVVCDWSGRVSLWTREKRPIDVPDNLRPQLAGLGLPPGTVMDGEIWNPLKRGSWSHNRSVRCLITLWDVVQVGGTDLGQAPIEARYERLASIVGGGAEDVSVVERIPATAEALREVRAEAEARRSVGSLRSGFIHGVVLKRRGSPRRDHCSRCVEHADWRKIVFWSQN